MEKSLPNGLVDIIRVSSNNNNNNDDDAENDDEGTQLIHRERGGGTSTAMRLYRMVYCLLGSGRVFCLLLFLTFGYQLLTYTLVIREVSRDRGDVPPAPSLNARGESEMAAYSGAGLRGVRREYFYSVSFIGGALAGMTHFFILPLDIIKCRVQVGECESLRHGLRHVFEVEAGRSWRVALPIYFKGWAVVLIGYALQGSVKFLLYEFFKSFWIPDQIQLAQVPRHLLPPPLPKKQQTMVYLLAGAAAEVFGDIPLIPWETLKVQMQTTASKIALSVPPLSGVVTTIAPAPSLVPNPIYPLSFSVVHMSTRIWQTQGRLLAFYRGLLLLWMRQIPYTAAKFYFFEISVKLFTALYLFLLHGKAAGGGEQPLSGATQLLISLVSGLVAGALSAFVSHPADTILSKLNHPRSSRGGGGGNNSTSSSFLRSGRSWWATLTREHSMLWEVWNGVLLRMLMVSIMTAMQWVLYDTLKVACGFAATGSSPKHPKEPNSTATATPAPR